MATPRDVPPAYFARRLVDALGVEKAESYAVDQALRVKTPWWLEVVAAVKSTQFFSDMTEAQVDALKAGASAAAAAHAEAQARRRPGDRPVVLSYGGGLDSFCMLLEGVRRGERIDKVIFLDVTDPEQLDPGEWPSTYRHIRDVVMPFCKKHNIPFVWLTTKDYPVRAGMADESRSLFQWIARKQGIPVAQPNIRNCTMAVKVERFQEWLADNYPGQDVEVWIGFEAGEEGRANKDPNAGKIVKKKGKKPVVLRALRGGGERVNRFPLIEWKLCRCRCAAIARASGFPVPRKSACMFCPLGSKGDWQTLAREQPERFQQIHQLELDKPPTAVRKLRLSIMGFKVHYHPDDTRIKKGQPGWLAPSDRRILRVTTKFLPEYILGKTRPRKIGCEVCGAEERATKATGSDYLTEAEMAKTVPRRKLPIVAAR
jgi:hypothetical protein